jgi:hypothetical protein
VQSQFPPAEGEAVAVAAVAKLALHVWGPAEEGAAAADDIYRLDKNSAIVDRNLPEEVQPQAPVQAHTQVPAQAHTQALAQTHIEVLVQALQVEMQLVEVEAEEQEKAGVKMSARIIRK